MTLKSSEECGPRRQDGGGVKTQEEWFGKKLRKISEARENEDNWGANPSGGEPQWHVQEASVRRPAQGTLEGGCWQEKTQCIVVRRDLEPSHTELCSPQVSGWQERVCVVAVGRSSVIGFAQDACLVRTGVACVSMTPSAP